MIRVDVTVNGRRRIEERFDRRGNFAQLKSLLNEALQEPAAVAANLSTEIAQCYDPHCLH